MLWKSGRGINMVKIIMDGMEVEAQRSETILDVSLRMGIDIPTLCHLDLHDIKMVNRSASCRICMVQIEGRANLAPACATPVEEGMVVWTNKVRVLNARKVVLELMLSDHPKDCLVCAKSGSCELQISPSDSGSGRSHMRVSSQSIDGTIRPPSSGIWISA